MAKSKIDKLKTKYKVHKEDTGSTQVQIVGVTERIAELTKHLRGHKKDYDSRAGLLKMIGKRRRLLNYLKKEDEKQYEKIVKDLNLRK